MIKENLFIFSFASQRQISPAHFSKGANMVVILPTDIFKKILLKSYYEKPLKYLYFCTLQKLRKMCFHCCHMN